MNPTEIDLQYDFDTKAQLDIIDPSGYILTVQPYIFRSWTGKR
ncbi:unnamed protein product, partial [marine sediment metagenome]